MNAYDAIASAADLLFRPRAPARREVSVPTLVHNAAGEAFLLENLFDSLDDAQDWLAQRERERLLGNFTD